LLARNPFAIMLRPLFHAAVATGVSRRQTGAEGRGRAGEPPCIGGDDRTVGRIACRGSQADREHAEGAELPAGAIVGVNSAGDVIPAERAAREPEPMNTVFCELF